MRTSTYVLVRDDPIKGQLTSLPSQRLLTDQSYQVRTLILLALNIVSKRISLATIMLMPSSGESSPEKEVEAGHWFAP